MHTHTCTHTCQQTLAADTPRHTHTVRCGNSSKDPIQETKTGRKKQQCYGCEESMELTQPVCTAGQDRQDRQETSTCSTRPYAIIRDGRLNLEELCVLRDVTEHKEKNRILH